MQNKPNRTARLGAICLAVAGLHAGSARAATYFHEDFESYADNAAVAAAGWIINDNSATAESDWTITNPGGRPNPAGSTGKFMVSDDDNGSPDAGGPGEINEELISPAINVAGAGTVWLHFATISEPNDNGDTINNVDISSDGGATWETVWTSASPTAGQASYFDGDGVTVIDGTSDGRITPVHVNITSKTTGKTSVQLRFHHLNATDDWYWIVDNIMVDDAAPFAGGADVLLPNEGFEGDEFPPADWQVVRNSPNLEGNLPWARDDSGGFRNAGGFSGNNFINRISPDHYAILDSDANPDADPEDESLWTKSINATEYAKLYLHVASEIKFNIGKTIADIEVSGDGGTSWSTLYSYDYRATPRILRSGEVYYDDLILDASVAAGSPNVVFRFHYRGNGDEWFWGIDDVKVTGTKGVVVLQQPPAKPTLTAPATVSFFDVSVALSGDAFSDPNAGDTLGSALFQFSDTPDFDENSGLVNVKQENSSSTTSLNTSFQFATPGTTVYATVQYVDSTGLKSKFSDVKIVAVGDLPAPFAFENFESTAPGEIPTGWSVANDTTPMSPDFDIAVLGSATYENWTVIPFDILGAVGNPNDGRGRGPVDGQSIYAESDTRSGTQIQYLTTPDFNATGKQNVWVVFKSNYVQNQDNMNGLEYSVDEGATWLPILYMVDAADLILDGTGAVDGEATMSAVRGDHAARSVTDPDTGEVTRVASAWKEFILARPLSALGPFISGRVNDDKFESKRIERFRLAAADNAAKVRLRFVQAGTASWWWGVDDFGLYEGPAGAVQDVQLSIAGRTAGSLTINWSGGTGKFLVQKKAELTAASWINVLTTTARTATVALDGGAGFFRVQSDFTGADVMPLTAYLSGDAEKPTAVVTPATGVGTLSLQGNTFSYLVTYNGLGSNPTMAHVHGSATTDSTTSSGVLQGIATPVGTSGYVSGTLSLTDTQRDLMLAGRTYLNIHTANNGGGEIRGNIMRTRYTATPLNGANERPNPVSPAGTGTATIWILGRELKYDLSWTDLTSNATMGHIHGRADATGSAGVLQGFTGISGTSGSATGVINVGQNVLGAILDGMAYVNIHTVNNGPGEIRGQIVP